MFGKNPPTFRVWRYHLGAAVPSVRVALTKIRKLCEGIRIPALTRAKAGVYVTAFRNSSTQNYIANKLARLVLLITIVQINFIGYNWA